MSSALGAVYLVAKEAKYDIPKDFSKNAKPFYVHSGNSSPVISKVRPSILMSVPSSDCITTKTHSSNDTDLLKKHANGIDNGLVKCSTNGHSNGVSNGHQKLSLL